MVVLHLYAGRRRREEVEEVGEGTALALDVRHGLTSRRHPSWSFPKADARGREPREEVPPLTELDVCLADRWVRPAGFVRVHVADGAKATDEVLDAIAGCRLMRDVCVTVSPRAGGAAFTAGGLVRLVAACTDLRRVTIEGCGALKELRFQSRSLESLSVAHAEALRTVELRCPQLSELSVHTAPLVPRAGGDAKPAPREHEHALARQIAECCPRLARLHFAVPGLADRGLAALLSNTPQGLKALCVTGAVNLTDQAVEAMVGCCPKLELVDLSGCASLTDAALETLAADGVAPVAKSTSNQRSAVVPAAGVLSWSRSLSNHSNSLK